MQVIIYKTETGIAIISPTPKIDVNDCLLAIPKGAEYKIVDASELPKDRTFRNAWGYDLKEDIEKSKEIWKDKLRAEREIAFKINDDKRKVAIRRGESVEEIDKEAERLCNVPQLVDACKTIDEIKEVTI